MFLLLSQLEKIFMTVLHFSTPPFFFHFSPAFTCLLRISAVTVSLPPLALLSSGLFFSSILTLLSPFLCSFIGSLLNS